MIDLVILTGVYGAGITVAKQSFEESGYFVTDNIPVAVAVEYFNVIEKESKKYSKIAVTVNLDSAKEIYKKAKEHKDFNVKFVGITCSSSVLNERFRVTRKMHPRQAFGESLEKCISEDIQKVREMRDCFDLFIDTTKLTNNEFKSFIYESCIGKEHKFRVNFYSFGYKISVPQDIETVFDVRLLPNPFWVPELKYLTGLDKPVIDYVLNAPETMEYLKHVINYLDFYLEHLRKNNSNHASIGIACTGGQHRSVVVAEYLAKHYSKKYKTSVFHKDLLKK